MLTSSAKNDYIFFAASFLFLLILFLLAPYQVIDPDSVAGFRALQGWKKTGNFNCILQPQPSDISSFHNFFLTWWSPGQYLFPYVLQKLFHLSLGRSITLLNFLAVFGGLVGFYKLFRIFQLPAKVILLSLVLILFSHTVLYRFVLYQGGETCSFLFFPWLTYWYVSIKNRILQAVMAILFLIAGFIAKSQLLIALIPVFLLIPLYGYNLDFKTGSSAWISTKVLFKRTVFVVVAIGIALGLIYVFFLSKGLTPANTASFNPSLEDTFTPLASPVTAIANGWAAIARLGDKYPAAKILLLMVSTAIVFFIFARSDLREPYTRLAYHYYIIGCFIFILLYYFDAHIDYDVRQQKFIAYLFFPVLISRLLFWTSFRKIAIGLALLSGIALVNHLRLMKIWFKDTYVTEGDVRVSKLEFPGEFYNTFRAHKGKDFVLFFAELSPKWAIDMPDIVCGDSKEHKIYNGHKYPVWYFQRNKQDWEDQLKRTFPEYKVFSFWRVDDYLLVELH